MRDTGDLLPAGNLGVTHKVSSMISNRFSLSLFALVVTTLVGSTSLRSAEEWQVVFNQNIGSEFSKMRQDALRQIDAAGARGLKTIFAFLDKVAPRDPLKYDWFVREGAYEALLKATDDEAYEEIEKILKSKGKANAKEAIIYSVIWKVRKQFEKDHGESDDKKIQEAKFFLRKKRGVEYFALVLPTCKQLDPDQRMLGWIKTAYGDKLESVRLAAIQGMLAYPDKGSVELLVMNLKKIEKKKSKMYKEWLFTRHALETLSGQYFRDNVEDWLKWWSVAKSNFSIEKRIEEEVDDDEDGEGRGKTVVATGGVEVTVQMKVAGRKDGYPLLVLPTRGYEPDYFRPYFHGIEEFCRVYYATMPQIGDFKGLKRDANSNTIIYPTEILSEALGKVLEDAELEKYAVLGHTPDACTQGISMAAKFPKAVSHLLLINPEFAGSNYSDALSNVKREGRRRKSPEVVNGVDNLLIKQNGKPTYEPADADEAGGMARALGNVAFANPASPEIGAMRFFYQMAGGQRVMKDSKWTLAKVFKKTPRLPVMVIMGERNPWTPINQMSRVAKFFKGSYTAKFKSSGAYMFMFEPYRFTREVQAWLKKSGAKLPDDGKKKKRKSRRSTSSKK